MSRTLGGSRAGASVCAHDDLGLTLWCGASVCSQCDVHHQVGYQTVFVVTGRFVVGDAVAGVHGLGLVELAVDVDRVGARALVGLVAASFLDRVGARVTVESMSKVFLTIRMPLLDFGLPTFGGLSHILVDLSPFWCILDRRGGFHAMLMVDFLIIVASFLIRHVRVGGSFLARCSIVSAMSSPGALVLLP